MKPSINFCVLILQERLADLERSGWESVLAEHPERRKQIEYEQHLNAERIEMLKEGIQKLQEIT